MRFCIQRMSLILLLKVFWGSRSLGDGRLAIALVVKAFSILERAQYCSRGI
mgnify:CR=1 FL=1